MKNNNTFSRIVPLSKGEAVKAFTKVLSVLVCMTFVSTAALAQFFPYMQNYRPSDKNGINIFEPKKDTTAYDGMKLRLGGGFTQQFQVLSHENAATPVYKKYNSNKDSIDVNGLYDITAGFNNASANLLIDVQLEDGVRLNLTTYLSSRHHQETWVKGGYIQFDRLRFLNSELIDNIMDILTIRIGHMEINYGDAHFRRSDGGVTIYNPFAENYIVDAFTTEIGGEVAFQTDLGIMGLVAMTNGEIKGGVDPLAPDADSSTAKSPSIYFKLGYDKKFGDAFRVRLTGSGYMNSASPRNTLYGGDRTGSNYFLVMESQAANYSASATSASAMKPVTTTQAFSGRYNPNFSRSIQAFVINGFVQFSMIELFLNYDISSGRASNEKVDRNMSQLAADLILRFGSDDQFFLAGRYNMVTTETQGIPKVDGDGNVVTNSDGTFLQGEQQISRIAAAAGWFLTPNILLKGEYVMQDYKDFPKTNIFNQGSFNGLVMEAVIGF